MSKPKRHRMWRKLRRWCKRCIIAAWDCLVRFVAWAERNGILEMLIKLALTVAFSRVTGQIET